MPDKAQKARELVDDYLLGEPVSKPVMIAALLADRSREPAAAAFYRALEAIGVRAADEAIVALRLVLAGKQPSDGAVRRLRALARVARAAATDDRSGVAAAVAADAAVLGDVAPGTALPDMRAVVKHAYFRELNV